MVSCGQVRHLPHSRRSSVNQETRPLRATSWVRIDRLPRSSSMNRPRAGFRARLARSSAASSENPAAGSANFFFFRGFPPSPQSGCGGRSINAPTRRADSRISPRRASVRFCSPPMDVEVAKRRPGDCFFTTVMDLAPPSPTLPPRARRPFPAPTDRRRADLARPNASRSCLNFRRRTQAFAEDRGWIAPG